MQRTEAYTYFTVPDGVTKEVYSFTYWATVRLLLETAGPVAVGIRQDIGPVLSGRGILLPSGGPEISLEMQKGDRLYVLSNSVNRVKLVIVPNFLQEATEMIDQTTQGTVPGIVSGFASAVRALLAGQAPATPAPDKPITLPKLRPPRIG